VRIVHLYKDYFPPTVGGIEQTVERMATAMVRRGHDVTVLTSHPGARHDRRETIDGVHVVRMAEWARIWSTPFCPGMPAALGGLPADVYHLHFPSPPGEVSWLLRRPPGALVITWHSDVVRQRAVMPVYGHAVHALVRAADAVMPIFAGQAEASPYLRHHPGKMRVVGLGTDLERYEAPAAPDAAGGPVVLFVGRVVGSKGLDVLLDAVPLVPPPARFVIVGDGPELPRLRNRAGSLGLGERVEFTGRVDPGRVREFVSRASVGVLPSLYESYGLAMVEIMVNAVPMVCTGLGTGTTFINRHEETGLVVPPADPASLAAAIRRLLEDDALRRRLGSAARERAKRLFSTEAMTAALAEVYDEVVAARDARR
jgi:glycosyltransferase involved in cell wall biosynthesis